MVTRKYGQYCGLARALEIVGERWSLLVIRDLLTGAKRFTDLLTGLPGIPTNILTARLKELEASGIIRRRVLPRPAASIVYELTEYGMELEAAVVQLGLWGAKSLGDPKPGEVVTPNSLMMALRSTFRPEAARRLHLAYELRLGEIVLHARVDNGKLKVGRGTLPDSDLVIETGPAIKALMSGELSPADAIKNGLVRLTGNRRLLNRFVEMFRIEPMPAEIGLEA